MPDAFAVTTPATTVPLGSDRRADLAVTVTNVTGRPLRARLRLVPTAPAAADWFAIAGDAEREYGLGATQSYTVAVHVPDDVPAGTYSLRCDATAEDQPDEDFAQGPTVALVVPAVARKKPFPWWIVAVAAAVVLLIVLIAVVKSHTGKTSSGVPVPNVTGASAPRAIAAVAGAGFKPSPASVTGTGCTPTVAGQSPSGGAKAAKGSTVKLTFASCSATTVAPATTVPDVVGQTYTAAIGLLARAGLATNPPNLGTTPCDPVVLNQTPAAGSAASGQTVQLSLGVCAGYVVVPSVIGQSYETASSVLTGAGLTPQRNQSTSKPGDTVTLETPPAGSQVQRGGIVVLFTRGPNG
jgi:serine/threonine-protein kinase